MKNTPIASLTYYTLLPFNFFLKNSFRIQFLAKKSKYIYDILIIVKCVLYICILSNDTMEILLLSNQFNITMLKQTNKQDLVI